MRKHNRKTKRTVGFSKKIFEIGMTYSCEYCSNKYVALSANKRYCSEGCQRLAYSKRTYIKTPIVEKLCKGCDEPFKTNKSRQVYCRASCRPDDASNPSRHEIGVYRILERDNFKCAYCGAKALSGAELHVDHLIPFSKGGDNTADNLITACKECNLSKSNRTFEIRTISLYQEEIKARNKSFAMSDKQRIDKVKSQI